MSFQFSLAAVLRIRLILEEREERVLQQITFEISQTMRNLERIGAGMESSNASRRAEIFQPVIGGHIHLCYGEVKGFQQSRQELETQLRKLQSLRDQQLRIFETARRNREMLTDMRGEKRTAYDAETARRQQKVLDDNYIARRGRKLREPDQML